MNFLDKAVNMPDFLTPEFLYEQKLRKQIVLMPDDEKITIIIRFMIEAEQRITRLQDHLGIEDH